MAFDGYFCAAVAYELQNMLGARVDKIWQSAATAFALSLFCAGKHPTLLLSVAAATPIIALSDEPPLKTDTPTSLCMLFRKHLLSSRVSKVEAVRGERVIIITFDATDDMGYPVHKHLVAEMMGKYSNLILCSDEMNILGATSMSDITEGARPVMPGIKYELPPAQNKLDLSELGEAEFCALSALEPQKKCASFLLSRFSRLSPLTAREIVFRACGDCDALTGDIKPDALWSAVHGFISAIENNEFTPCVVGSEYSFTELTQYGKNGYQPSFSALLLSFYGSRERENALASHSRDILKTVENALSRVLKKAEKQRAELAACAEKEVFRAEGDLITANIYRIKKGDLVVSAIDYESGSEVLIKLDSRLSPAQNAQARYKKYAKLKRAEAELKLQLAKAAAETDYLQSVADSLARAETVRELEDIRRELADTGYIKVSDKTKLKKLPPQKPLERKTSGGYLLRIGRNNRENDSLTGSAAKDDLWFHIKGFHGSHVILYAAGSEPDARDYTEAAMFAAWHSEKRGSRNIEVDYTRVRYLKKPSGSAPGFVTYDKYFTAVVDAAEPEITP